ncbi:MAG: hypothetical protein L6461_14170 [Anaerolineae bacterium]|nr:hypothetical protein [Anaerolineae bacterium]
MDLLNHLLDTYEHSQDEPIDSLVQNARAVYPTEASLDNAMPSPTDGYALMIVQEGKPSGILTKIDVLDFVAGKI